VVVAGDTAGTSTGTAGAYGNTAGGSVGEITGPGGRAGTNGTAEAGTLFIAPDGDDANDGRTPGNPLRTFARANALALPGDVVKVRGGVYKEFVSITSSGTERNPVIYEPYDSEAVIIDGSAIAPDSSHPDPWNWTPRLFSITGSYIIVRGFEGRNSPNVTFFLSGHHLVIEGVHAHYGYHSGIQLWQAHSSQVLYSIVHNVFDAYQGGQNADCITLNGGDLSHHNVIRGNEVYNCSDDGIDTWDTSHNLVEGNIAHHCGRGSRGNGNGFKLGGPGGDYNIARFNVAYLNRSRGFTTNTAANDLIHNNTAWRNGGVAFHADRHANTLQNNIAVPARVDLKGSTVSQDNSWDLDVADPAFRSVDPANPSFLRLSGGSPVIDQGVLIPGVTYRGAAPDLGAYEYGP
jgi:parallel beta-helix repeat protein